MDDEIELVSDGDGLAIVGERSAVERYLRSAGLWSDSRELDLGRLRRLLILGSDVAQAASDIAAKAGRWIKLTEESARLVAEEGLMDSKVEGESHLMIGDPGAVRSWLQAETGTGGLLSNPEVLSGLAGIMAQAAKQQNMAEITAYLASIDEKVDDVLAKVDDTVLKDMRGARFQIRRAMTMREHEGSVTGDAWSEVQNASGKLADVQGYALQQLETIAKKLEGKSSVGGLSQTTGEAKNDVRQWLAVLAETFHLQEAFDVLVLDRALVEPPTVADSRRRGLEADRTDRIDLVYRHTEHLLTRMDAAVERANAKMIWARTKSLAVVEAGNQLAVGVHEFRDLLGIKDELRSWDARQLRPSLDVGAKVIQGAKDNAPTAAAIMTLVGAAAVVGKKAGGTDAA